MFIIGSWNGLNEIEYFLSSSALIKAEHLFVCLPAVKKTIRQGTKYAKHTYIHPANRPIPSCRISDANQTGNKAMVKCVGCVSFGDICTWNSFTKLPSSRTNFWISMQWHVCDCKIQQHSLIPAWPCSCVAVFSRCWCLI